MNYTPCTTFVGGINPFKQKTLSRRSSGSRKRKLEGAKDVVTEAILTAWLKDNPMGTARMAAAALNGKMLCICHRFMVLTRKGHVKRHTALTRAEGYRYEALEVVPAKPAHFDRIINFVANNPDVPAGVIGKTLGIDNVEGKLRKLVVLGELITKRKYSNRYASNRKFLHYTLAPKGD